MPSFTRRPRPGTAPTPGSSSTPTTASTSSPAPTSSSSSTASARLATAQLAGTKPYPSAPTRFTSTGIASLDDVLGAGLPLGSTLTLLAPDPHTQWSRLVARHVASAGVLDGQRVVILAPGGREGRAEEWVAGMPWVEGASGLEAGEGEDEGSASETEAGLEDDGRTKIAWRYDKVGRFKTTVGSSRLAANTTLPPALRAQLESSGKISYADPGESVTSALEAVAAALASPSSQDAVVRVVVPDLGSPEWPLSSTDIVRFLLGLRALLRPRAAIAVVTLPPRLSSSPPTHPSSIASALPSSSSSSNDTASPSPSTSATSNKWISTLAHASDACITLQGFGTSPGHFRAFSPLHGLLTPHSLPGSHHLLAPALRHSTLLGVRDGGEQNLGFRLKRKKWVVESVHLGIEGGTSERRVGPVETPAAPSGGRGEGVARFEGVEGVERAGVEGVESDGRPQESAAPKGAEGATGGETPKPKEKKKRSVRFGGDEVEVSIDTGKQGGHGHDHGHGLAHGHSHGQHKERVEIRHDRPDLYEF